MRDRGSSRGRCGLLLAALSLYSALTARCDETHWALKPAARPTLPTSTHADDVRHPIDLFVFGAIESRGLMPSKQVDRVRLIRRVTIDLTGLPPTFAEVSAFLKDQSPDAYEQLVERLLASPGYGERWAQHWLDVVRYADSDGFEYDDPRPWAWRYRDWVIDVFDRDYAYDRFVADQIAGDQIAPSNRNRHIPTGLHRLGPIRKNAGNQDEKRNRQEALVQMTDAVGFAFMGMTIGCAKCHDHKFDPISQAEYYELQAFFAGTIACDVPLVSDDVVKQHENRNRRWQTETEQLKKQISEYADSSTNAPKIAKLRAKLQLHLDAKPDPLDAAMAVRELVPTPSTFVLERGNPDAEGDLARPQFPAAIGQLSYSRHDAPRGRTALARWLTAVDHPLTSRVMVNRLWQFHFGRGLVATPSDFGRMGSPPSHPQLLDWLAVEFAESGWSIKHLQRLLVTSATYRQASEERAREQQADPKNVLLWRMPYRRMDAETIRDATLFVANDLNRSRHGPGVRLKYSDEVTKQQYKGEWTSSANPSERSRRSVYRFVKRNLQTTLFTAFDAPDTLVSCSQRTVSTHSGQALALLNGSLIDRQSYQVANRILATAPAAMERAMLVERAYETIVARHPNAEERRMGIQFLEHQTELVSKTEKRPPADRSTVCAALADYCLVLMNLDEFLFY